MDLFLVPYLYKNKVSLQTSLERNSSNFSYISFLGMNFENLTVEFHVPYILNIHIKFHSNRILFTIWSINLFFIYNFRLQKLEIITFIWWHSNWSLIFLKFCKHFRCNKNMQFNGWIFKIHTQYKYIWWVCRVSLQTSLKRNFVLYIINLIH